MTPAQMTEHGSIILTADETNSVIDALDELANDLAYLGREDERTAQRADAISQLADRLRARRDGAPDQTMADRHAAGEHDYNESMFADRCPVCREATR